MTAIAAGGEHVLALLAGGTAEAWGEDFDGQLGDGGPPSSTSVPVAVQDLTGAVAVSAGEEFSLALLSDGTVMGWGDNGFNELGQSDGIGGIGSSNVPVRVPGLSQVTAISAGGLFGLALRSGGTVDSWGDGAFGQLGNGGTDTLAAAAAIPGLSGVTAVAAGGVSAAAVVSTTAPAPPAPTPSVWRVVPTPAPHNINQVSNVDFSAVSATGRSDAWAVGSHEVNGQLPLAEHWDGTAWSQRHVPLPAGVTGAGLNAVHALSPSDAWAVGNTAAGQTLIEHWNGTRWSVVPSPDPGVSNDLEGISGTGPDDLWAAGWFENDAETFIALLLLHWDGHAWTMSPPPAEGGTQLGEAVTAITPRNVWVVGDTATGTVSAHWNGTSWRLIKTPFLHTKDSVNHLTGITATSADDVWASGYEGNVNDQLFSQPYMLHWAGSSWTLVKTPNAGTEGSSLRATVALSPSDVWAVGITGQSDGALLALTEHYNGSTWSISPALDPGQLSSAPDNSLFGLASPAPGTLWAVGDQEVPGQCCTRTLALTATSG